MEGVRGGALGGGRRLPKLPRRGAPRQRSLAVLRPDLAAQLHPTRNGDLDPHAVGLHSRRVVWWRCPGCGQEWTASIQGRAGGQGRCAGCRRPAPAVESRAVETHRQAANLDDVDQAV